MTRRLLQPFTKLILPSKRQLQDKKLQNRMKMCALAICLMWCSSLKIAVYIASFVIDVPPIQLVYRSCKGAFHVIANEREMYNRCVDVQINQCHRNLDLALMSEFERVNASAAQNRIIAERVKAANINCTSNYASLRYSLESWVNSENGTLPLNDNTSTCSIEERQEILSTVGDINAIRSEAFLLSDKFSQNSQWTVSKISSYAQARAIYDQEYIDNHTQAMQDMVQLYMDQITVPRLDLSNVFDDIRINLDGLISCISIRHADAGVCKHFKGAQEFVDEAYDQFLDVIDRYYNGLVKYGQKAEEYRDNAWDAFRTAQTFYNGAKIFIRDNYLDKLGIGSWFDISIGAFEPIDVEWPGIPFVGDISILHPTQVWNNVQPALLAYRQSFNQAADTISQLVNKLSDDIELELRLAPPNLIPEDYSPPQYIGSRENVSSIQDEEEDFVIRSESFVLKSGVALDAFSLLQQEFDEEDNFVIDTPSINITKIENRISNLDIKFETLAVPDIDIDLWFLQFASISSLLFFLDYSLRAYFAIRLCFKYWDAGVVQLPEVDMRTEKESSTNPFKMSYVRLIFLFVTNPFVGVLLATLVGTWVIKTASSVYTPLYREYSSGCILSNGNGTFVTENLYSLAYNSAYEKGSSSLMEGIESFDLKISRTCTSSYAQTASRQNVLTAEVASYEQSLNMTEGQMSLLEKCIDASVIDDQFRKACCGRSGYGQCNSTISTNSTDSTYSTAKVEFICPIDELKIPSVPYLPPGSYLSLKSCETDTQSLDWSLEDATFSCNSLPPCDITCKGPHKEKIRTVTKECGCMVEWFLYSAWLEVILALFVYILMNISRISFMDGLGRVLWEKLRPSSFTVWTTCDRNGSFVTHTHTPDQLIDCEDSQPGSQHDTKPKYIKNKIQDKIEKRVKLFRMRGVAIIVGALLLNIPWIFLITQSTNKSKPKWLVG